MRRIRATEIIGAIVVAATTKFLYEGRARGPCRTGIVPGCRWTLFRGAFSAAEPAWRGFLSLRDPAGAAHAAGSSDWLPCGACELCLSSPSPERGWRVTAGVPATAGERLSVVLARAAHEAAW